MLGIMGKRRTRVNAFDGAAKPGQAPCPTQRERESQSSNAAPSGLAAQRAGNL